MNETLPPAEVMTVLGPVPADRLGITLPHEHIFLDVSCWWTRPTSSDREFLIDARVCDIDRDLLLADPYHNRDNLVLNDEDIAISELELFKQAGGRTIIDLTTRTIGPYPDKLRKIAERTGLNIIASTGFYVRRSHSAAVAEATYEELADQMIKELNKGIEDTSIRAGIIGEIGTSSPIHPDEAKVLRAAAMAHEATGAAINVHMTIFAREGHNVLDILENCGVDPGFVALSHLDELQDSGYHSSLAKRGCFIEFDCFGSQCAFEEDHSPEPTDAERISSLMRLLDQGYEKQMLLSQDVCTKMQLRHYGGNGYDHILRTIVPQLSQLGVGHSTLHALLADNPARLLAGKMKVQSLSTSSQAGRI